MTDTPLSLLQRLSSRSDESDWRRLFEIYAPLIRRWLAGYGVTETEAEDLLQDVFVVLLREIGSFKHNGHAGSFRRWLKLMMVNRLKRLWRSRKMHALAGGNEVEVILKGMEDPVSDPNLAWDQEHDAYVVNALLKLVEPQFTVSTWQAFRMQVLDGSKSGEVAKRLGITVNAALIAKSRVMRALRGELAGLIEFD